MSWLRLCDTFGTSPKIDQLSEAQAWRWVLVLLYCAQHETDGLVTSPTLKRIGLDRGLLVRLELLEERESGLFVHDFLEYNPSKEERERERERWRDRKRSSRSKANVTDGHSRDSTGESDVESQGILRSPSPGTKEGSNTHRSLVRENVARVRTEAELQKERETLGRVQGAFPSKLRHAERAIWESMSSDERSAVVAAHSSSTGVRFVRGSHGASYVVDALGVDRVERNEAPAGYDGRATPSEYLAAWAARRAGVGVLKDA